jgi:hypothetical protein
LRRMSASCASENIPVSELATELCGLGGSIRCLSSPRTTLNPLLKA